MAQKRLGNSDVGTGITIDVVLIGAAVAGVYFLVLKPILGNLGLGDSASQAAFTAEQAVPAAQNPFNYQFQPFIDFYNQNPPGPVTVTQGWTAVFGNLFGNQNSVIATPTIQQYFNYLKFAPGTPSPWGILDSNALSQIAESLYSGLQAGLFSGTNQDAAMSPLQQINSQLGMAFVSNYFWWNFNLDLLTSLQGSLFKQGLTPDNLVLIINKVNSLPLYTS